MNKETHENEEIVHVYDGIEELDNQLPKWWVWLFYIFVAFAPLYMGYYHIFGVGSSSSEKFAKAEAKFAEHVKAMEAQALADGGPKELVPITDEKTLAKGQVAFMTYCMQCHFSDGGGIIGPNLTDDYWLHGDTYADSVHTIQEGVPERGMISWKAVLKPADIEAIASFIYTLRGVAPAKAKGPEGIKLGADGHVLDEKPRMLAPPAP